MMDLTASSDPKFYLGNTLTALRTWRDWKDYAPLVKKVAELTAGKTDDFEKAKAILNWTQTSKAYACPELYAQCPDSPANNNAEFSTIFDSDIGVCLDAAIISTAMLRVAGISATPRMISVGHIVTLFYANGLWYSADATFSTNRATAGQVDIANAAEARNRFLPFVAGEIESDMKLNGLYCDNEFCMGIPFRANRVLSNSGVKTTQITFPAMTIAEYDLKTRNQVLCTLKTRGVVSDVLGSFVTIYENNPWQSAEVAYFIGDGAAQDTPYGNVPVGYITANVPVGSAAETENKIEYRFECHRGYAWGVDSGKPIAYKEVIPRLGENVTISYSDMIKDTSASDEEFAKVIALVKASTEDLGIYPDSPITESLADPASRE